MKMTLVEDILATAAALALGVALLAVLYVLAGGTF